MREYKFELTQCGAQDFAICIYAKTAAQALTKFNRLCNTDILGEFTLRVDDLTAKYKQMEIAEACAR